MTQDTRIIGNKSIRHCFDAAGKPLKVGDMISYCTRQGSSIFLNFGKVAEVIYTDEAAYVGYEPPRYPGSGHVRVYSWDYAYKLKVIPYEFNKLTEAWHTPKKYDRNLSKYVDTTEDDVKLRRIDVVTRVLRLDV